MDDLEGQIREVLGDPAQMAQIMSLAQSLMGSGGEGKQPETPPEKTESGLLGKIGDLMKQQGGQNDQQALLRALRPYLSEKRQHKVDRALQITRLAHLAKLALEGMGGSGDA